MNALPQGAAGKILALAITAALLIAVFLALVAPLASLYAAEEETVRARETLAARMQADARDLPLLRSIAQKWRDYNGADPLLFDETSDGAAAARLQAALKDLTQMQGAKLASSEILAPERRGKFRRIGLRVAFSGDMEILANILAGVEDAHPVLAVGAVDILDRQTGDGAGTPSVALDVYGFRAQ